MKKVNKLLVALALFGLSAGATTAFAQTYDIGDPVATDVKAVISGSGSNLTLTISGTGKMQDFSDGTGPAPWYSIRTNIKTLVINSGVTSIGYFAFSGFSGLTGSLTIPNSVTTIGNEAFYGCSGFTGTLTIPNSVTTIKDYAFYGCSGFTGALTIPNSVTIIKDGAFAYCSGLTGALTIPNSVTTIGNSAFNGCSSLTTINVEANNPNYSSEGGILYNKNKTTLIQYPAGKTGIFPTIPNSVTTIGNSAFNYCNGLTGSLTIPNSVTTIGERAFYNCSGFTGSLTIPNSVTTIGNSAFSDCSGLTTVNFNATNCTTMGSYNYPVFSGCTNLTTLNIGENVTKIPDNAFNNCSGLTGSLTIPNSVTTIGIYAFLGCSGFTSSLTIGNSVTTIGYYAFYYCSGLTTVNFNATNCTTMGNSSDPVFKNCTNLKTLNIGENVTKIPDYAFYNCSGLTGSLTIPNSVTTIGYQAFYGCNKFTSLSLGNNVASIGYFAFYNCSGFTGSLTIPNAVTTIGGAAFYGCSGLTSVTVNWATPLLIDSNVFYGITLSNINLYVPSSKECMYATAAVWKDFQSIGSNNTWVIGKSNPCDVIAILENGTLTITGTGDMKEFSSSPWYSVSTQITQVNIGNSVTSIGNYAFCNCSGLTGTLTITNSVTSIGTNAFYGCNQLTSLSLGNVSTIGDEAFKGCSGLTSINSPKTTLPVPTLGTNVFQNVPNYIPVNIPCGMTIHYTNSPAWSSAFYNYQDILSTSTITVQSNNNALGSASVTQQPTCSNPQAVIQAYANSGGCFTKWSDGVTDNPRTVSVISDITLTAMFAALSSITVQSNNSTMGSASVTQQPSCTNNQAIIQATTNNGYCFTQWNDGNTDNPHTISVTSDITLTAMFTALPSITVQSNNSAMGSASVTQQPTTCTNPQAIIQATANNGYCFFEWSDSNTVNPRTITITSDMTLTAKFTTIPNITVQSNDIAKGIAQVIQLPTCTNPQAIIQAYANSGYYFLKWSDENTYNPRTLSVTQDITLTAIFEAISGIDDIKDNQISIYPNPVKEVLIIKNEELRMGNYSIFNVSGQVLMQGALSTETTTINVKELPSGMYFIKVGSKTGKFIKE